MTEFTRKFKINDKEKSGIIKEEFWTLYVTGVPIKLEFINGSVYRDFSSDYSYFIMTSLDDIMDKCYTEDVEYYYSRNRWPSITYDEVARIVLSEKLVIYDHSKYCGYNCERCGFKE